MSNHAWIKVVSISMLFFFVGMMLTITSSPEKTSAAVSNAACASCGDNFFQDEGYPPRYVMDHVDLTPLEELSPKPEVMRDLPPAFSWKNYNGHDWTTPARDQSNCGSCWAFGAVSALEGIINIKWNDSDLDQDLSEQYILSCLPAAGSCGGGSSYSAYKYILSENAIGNYCNGIIAENCLLYSADDSVPCSDKCPNWRSTLLPITGFGSWNPHYPNDVNAIKSQLIDHGPVVTYFYATGEFASWGNSHHNPNDYYPYVPASSSNHAVAIVGYKDDASIGHGGYWIVKNSWGTGWGYQGFFNIEYGSLNIDNVQITYVDYNATPIVAFSTSPMDPDVGVPIQFSDASTTLRGSINSWSWDFGDGNISEDQHPSHAYAAVGTYLVRLEVTDTTGHVGSISRKVYVGDDEPPVTNTSLYGMRGDNDWYISNTVVIRLKALDVFSGVNYSMYNLDGRGWVLYDAPVFVYSRGNEGEHTLLYYSVDNVGNAENQQTMVFKIDITSPALAITKPKDGKVYVFNFLVSGAAQETIIVGRLQTKVVVSDSVSGINRVEFYRDGELTGIDTIPPYINVIRGFSNGADVEYTVTVFDNAGLSIDQIIHFRHFGFWY